MKNCFVQILLGTILFGVATGRAAETNNQVVAPHAQHLVVVQDDKLVPFKSESFLKAPYTVLYFGAGWCPDCRHFSPTLVDAYDRQPQGQKRFEVLLLTMDQTEADMAKFMRSEKMRWPALAFDEMGKATDLKKYYSGKGIPWLSVIDPAGRVVLQSQSDQDATRVLSQLQELLQKRK